MFIFRWIAKVCRFVGACLNYLNKTILYVLELALIVALIVAGYSFFKTPQVQPHSVLVLDLSGSVKEAPLSEPVLPVDIASAPTGVSLHELLATLNQAAKDPMIEGVLLRLDELDKVGLTSIGEIGKARVRPQRHVSAVGHQFFPVDNKFFARRIVRFFYPARTYYLPFLVGQLAQFFNNSFVHVSIIAYCPQHVKCGQYFRKTVSLFYLFGVI